ncbi:hypothetical protein [Algiphilus sp.]|uniref:hypothetical protein n=1 Tax=Algiphilus sp. TaxID=1872431 RepID=UPI0032F089BB
MIKFAPCGNGIRPYARCTTLPFVLLMALLSTIQPAVAQDGYEFWDGKVRVNGYISQGWQSIEADQGARPEATDTASGFNRLRANIAFTAQVSERISAYLELGEEPNDFEGTEFGQISQDLAFLDIAVNDWLVFRTGNIVTTVQNFIPYSDGAIVQGNPLIGNSPIDFITAEQGVQLIGSHPLGEGLFRNLGWDVSITNPNFFENFDGDRPYQVAAKLRIKIAGGLEFGTGIFQVDGSDQFTPAGGNGAPSPGGGMTSALWFGDGDNYNFPGTPTNSNETHTAIIPGIDAFLWLVDAKWQPHRLPLMLRTWFGSAEDEWRYVDSSGAQTTFGLGAADVIDRNSKIQYAGGEGKYDLTESLYVAVRYSFAENDSEGASGETDLDRTQIGGGYWLNEATLIKTEYVRQSEGPGGPGQIGADWDGVTAELSVVF